jgi:hypothetical protein
MALVSFARSAFTDRTAHSHLSNRAPSVRSGWFTRGLGCAIPVTSNAAQAGANTVIDALKTNVYQCPAPQGENVLRSYGCTALAPMRTISSNWDATRILIRMSPRLAMRYLLRSSRAPCIATM